MIPNVAVARQINVLLDFRDIDRLLVFFFLVGAGSLEFIRIFSFSFFWRDHEDVHKRMVVFSERKRELFLVTVRSGNVVFGLRRFGPATAGAGVQIARTGSILSFFDWLVFLPGADSVQVVGTKAGIALPRPSTELVDMTRRRGPVARNIPPDVRAAHPVRYAVYTSSRSPHVHVQVQQPGRCAHCCCGRPLVQ